MTEVLPALSRNDSPTEQVRALLEPHKIDILAKLAELAKAGDPRSISEALRYLAPVPQQEAEKVVVPGLKEAPTLPEKAAAILAAVADGQISAQAGDRLLGMLDSFGKVGMLQTQEQRMRLFESRKRRKAAPEPPKAQAAPADAAPAVPASLEDLA